MAAAIAIVGALLFLVVVATLWERRAAREREAEALFEKAMAMRPIPPEAPRAPIAATPAKRLAIVVAVAAAALAIVAAIGAADSYSGPLSAFDWSDRAYYWYDTVGRTATVLAAAAVLLWFGGPPFRRLVTWIARGRVE